MTFRTRPNTPDSFEDSDFEENDDSAEKRAAAAAAFRERRLRANKLAKFFGVGYGDIVPALTSDSSASISGSSTRPSGESAHSKGKGDSAKGHAERPRLAIRESGISITVSKEVDDIGRYSISIPGPLKKGTKGNRDSVDPASGGCYPGFVASASPAKGAVALARSLSMRRRAASPFQSALGAVSRENSNSNSGSSEELPVRPGSAAGRAPVGPHYQTTSARMRSALLLPRSDSPNKMHHSTLTNGSSASLLPIASLHTRSRSSNTNASENSMEEFGLGEPAVMLDRTDSIDNIVRKTKHIKGMGSIVRVGSKEADVSDIMGRLRELR